MGMCFSAHVYWMYYIADRFSQSLAVTSVHCYTLSLSVFLHAHIVMDGSKNGSVFQSTLLSLAPKTITCFRLLCAESQYEEAYYQSLLR